MIRACLVASVMESVDIDVTELWRLLLLIDAAELLGVSKSATIGGWTEKFSIPCTMDIGVWEDKGGGGENRCSPTPI